jgi:small subunit ribosomal protein S2
MADVGIRELLEAGVHFGHQTRRWNPKMRRFIFGERSGIYIIDLLKTQTLLENAQRFCSEIAHRGGTVLFVGTKKQARDSIKEVAESAGMPYVHHRWLGGLLTNFQTISLRIKRLHDLERYESEGQLGLLPTRERMAAEADLVKLRANLGGVKNMQRPPDAMFVVDLKTELIAVREAQRLRIPVIGLVDTNCDPDGIDYVIPGNDDAIKSCAIITQAIGDVVSTGHRIFREEEERARREAEEQARKEAEERQRREEEERQRKEAEEAAARQADIDAAEALRTQAAGEGDRQAAEQQVAAVVEEQGRPQAEGRADAEAAAAAQAADEPPVPSAPAAAEPAAAPEAPVAPNAPAPPEEAAATPVEAPPAPVEPAAAAPEEPAAAPAEAVAAAPEEPAATPPEAAAEKPKRKPAARKPRAPRKKDAEDKKTPEKSPEAEKA